MLLVSTGFKTSILGTNSFTSLFNGGGIYVYAGMRPSSPDSPPTSAPIGVVSNEGFAWNPLNTLYGLKFVQSGPYVLFDSAISAQLVPSQPATASWWRLVAPGDDGSLSYSQARIDGDCGLSSAPTGQELLLPTLALVPGVSVPTGYFLYTIPPIIGV